MHEHQRPDAVQGGFVEINFQNLVGYYEVMKGASAAKLMSDPSFPAGMAIQERMNEV